MARKPDERTELTERLQQILTNLRELNEQLSTQLPKEPHVRRHR